VSSSNIHLVDPQRDLRDNGKGKICAKLKIYKLITLATYSWQIEEVGPVTELPDLPNTAKLLKLLQRPHDFASSDVYLSSKIVIIRF
jgi:hypothetical protein